MLSTFWPWRGFVGQGDGVTHRIIEHASVWSLQGCSQTVHAMEKWTFHGCSRPGRCQAACPALGLLYWHSVEEEAGWKKVMHEWEE